MKQFLLAIAATCLLAGCGTFQRAHFENRITVTLGCDRAFVASLYGPIGITTEIDAKDVAVLPCGRAHEQLPSDPG